MLNKFRQSLIEWNLFASEDQNDDMNSSPSREITNADAQLLQEQRISTRLYVISLTTTSFILVISTLLSAEKNIITIHNPSLKVYKELHEKSPTTLNCPCLTNTMPYKQFIVAETAMHQICSSSFVSEQWISALFIPDASRYSGIDFRTTASSQFELLKTLCEVARDNIFESLLNLNNTQLLAGNLLPEKEIFIQTKTTSERIRSDTTIRLNNALKLIELLTQTNYFSSALNTNIVYFVNRIMFHEIFVYGSSNTAWYSIVNNETKICGCQFNTCFLPVGFYSFADEINFNRHTIIEPHKYNASDLVPGFFGACTPYEAIFQAKFICLYDIKCIKKLTHYFPRLVQLMSTIQPLNTSVPSKYPRNVTVNHLIQEIFLEQWRVSIDYIKYFAACAPKICTYSYTKQINFAYTITMLISLPGKLYEDFKCLCSFNINCGGPMIITHAAKEIIVPGFVWRCSAMDSILSSTLECLYSNTRCLTDILLRYINYSNTAVPVPPLNVSQLIRTTTHSTVATLADNLFVEEWRISWSHVKYFNLCAPNVCQYTYVKRANYLYVVTMFLAIYGGLSLALSLLAPLMIKLVVRFQHQSLSIERISIITLPRVYYQWLSQTMRKKIIYFNLFETYSFGRNIDLTRRIQLGHLTTRLYICFYCVGITILIFHSSFKQRTITENFYNPSLALTQQLKTRQNGTVECPCTRASIPLHEFVTIQTSFHEICTSTFVKDEWREALTINFNNISSFLNINDYRRFLSAHLQFLSGLCYQTMKHVNDSVRSFTSTSLITSRLLSQSSFDKQLSNLLYQTELHAPTLFANALELVQSINHGNVLMTVYASNYEFVARKSQKGLSTILYTLPITYKETRNCSCGLQSKCLTQAVFTWPRHVKVKGFLIGCLPSESFLASTLECFFDVDCINLLRNHMSGNVSYLNIISILNQSSNNLTTKRFIFQIHRTHVLPLNGRSMVHSRFQINTTVNELVKKLFVEEWSTNISYERYFSQCAPNICTYFYIDNANTLYVANTLLGLYGGLTVVLDWWCPQLVKLIQRIQDHYNKKRRVCSTSNIS
ncbi:unnamed protein product [Rotaria magnacalcarata]|uniref:Uncharacterized protein n=1 Tax=Rotaria magnacalcarata TaxID=392030 RepID=A0A8S2JMJ7_9BILA|nr:unnamed protein product [Rotaria magnacalcarata]